MGSGIFSILCRLKAMETLIFFPYFFHILWRKSGENKVKTLEKPAKQKAPKPLRL